MQFPQITRRMVDQQSCTTRYLKHKHMSEREREGRSISNLFFALHARLCLSLIIPFILFGTTAWNSASSSWVNFSCWVSSHIDTLSCSMICFFLQQHLKIWKIISRLETSYHEKSGVKTNRQGNGEYIFTVKHICHILFLDTKIRQWMHLYYKRKQKQTRNILWLITFNKPM